MSRLDSGYSAKVPNLYKLTDQSAVVTIADLFNPEHPVNNKSVSGKDYGSAVMIDGHVWVAEGSQPYSSWHRFQKHTEATTGIYRQINNTLANASAGDGTWYDAAMSNFAPVETFLTGEWSVTDNTGILTYTNTIETIYKFIINGDISSDHAAAFGDTIGIQFYRDSTADGLTSMTKVLPVAKSVGGSGTIADFTLIGFARVQPDEIFRIQVASNFADDLVIDNVIMELHPMDALFYI